ncbi:MAG TPA: CHAT domain-containing protein [Jatrophihabitans sp.]|nr:CHAT domain-containing protein [Jatrophihabitans sp.]
MPILRRALEAVPVAGGAELSARIWISIATSESELGGLARGMAALAEAQRHVSSAAQPDLQASLDNQLGYMLVRGGKVAEGLGHLNAAVDRLEQVEPAIRYSILLNRGTTHLFRGDLRSARTDLSQAVQVARAEQMRTAEAKAQHNLGYLEFLAGNLATGLRMMDEVLELEADVSAAVILLDRARVMIEAGLHRDADASLRRAGELFRAARLAKDVGEVELARAECALLDGEVAAARRLATSARDRFRRRGNDRWRRDAELVLLQADLVIGRPGLAPVALRLAEEYEAESLGTPARTARLIAAEALLRAGSVAEAGEVARGAGTIRAGDAISARLQTRLVRGRLHWANGDRPAARREIRTGLAELARHQARFGSIDVQTAGAVHGRQLAELNVTLALADGRPRGVLAAVELSRATSSRIRPVVAPDDPIVADLLAELRRHTEELRALSSDSTAAARVAAVRRRMAEIEQSLRAQSWHWQGTGNSERAASPEQILAGLAEAGAVGVSYLATERQLHGLVISPDGLRLVSLGESAPVFEWTRRIRADLDMLAHGSLPEPIADAVRRSLRRSLENLDRTIVAPLGLPEVRLVLSPTGPLAVLPWGMMPSLRACPVVVVPSGTAWLLARADRATGVRASAEPCLVRAFAGPGLSHAETEAAAVAAIWSQASALAGADAHRAAVKSALAEARMVHLAAHGTHHAENPLFSSVRLADGPVFAYELDHTAGSAEHVVLAACELGQATIRPGDEALGLTSVLLRLGTRSVISGVAKVHDRVAAEVMLRYHKALAGGMDSDRALAEACAVSEELPAPFVCFGAAWRL